MKSSRLFVAILAVTLGSVSYSQQPTTPPAPVQSGGQTGGQDGGQRGGGRGFGMGQGVAGTVTEVAADHYTIKTETGDTYTVHFSANTRIMKMSPRPAGAQPGQGQNQGQGEGQGRGQGRGFGGGTPPTAIKSTDIKVGDAIVARGQQDDTAKSVGAVMVLQIDPETAKQMAAMQANYGKTWLMGKVTAVNETKVSLLSPRDNTTHTFVADENTTFRKRRDPITLGDVQVGDNVRVEGAIKDGQFIATTVNVMAPQVTGGPARRQGDQPPPQ